MFQEISPTSPKLFMKYHISIEKTGKFLISPIVLFLQMFKTFLYFYDSEFYEKKWILCWACYFLGYKYFNSWEIRFFFFTNFSHFTFYYKKNQQFFFSKSTNIYFLKSIRTSKNIFSKIFVDFQIYIFKKLFKIFKNSFLNINFWHHLSIFKNTFMKIPETNKKKIAWPSLVSSLNQ